ncbi:MAG: PAS domain S-box protein [Hyphomonadaceae bacterium]|nr:PAS domain S-box protein [Hyphomonadaceae bacterium]
MPDRVAVTSADFVRNIGRWQNEALQHPISITHHGRERLVLVSSRRYEEALSAARESEVARRLSDRLGVIEILLDPAMRILSASHAFYRHTGHAQEDVLGKLLTDLAQKEDCTALTQRLQRILKAQDEGSLPLFIARPSRPPLALTAACALRADKTLLILAALLP